MLKECLICGNEFRAYKRNQKYCSDECRLEKDRLRKRKEREKERSIRIAEKQRIQQEKQLAKEEAERMQQEEEERKLFELKRRANEGDPKARMKLAPRFSAEYWEAYRDYQIEENSQFENSKFVRYVNGISVFDDDFAEKVMFTIEERGHIMSELMRVQA